MATGFQSDSGVDRSIGTAAVGGTLYDGQSGRELNRAILIGSIFIITTAGSAYMCGALSNVWFNEKFGLIAVDAVKDQELMSAAYEKKISGGDLTELKRHKIAEKPQTISEAKLSHGNPDLIIPAFINLALPRWMVYILR